MKNKIVSIIVHGASGRLGSRICAIALADPSFVLTGAIERADSEQIGQSVAGATHAKNTIKYSVFEQQHADVVIDFSSDEGAHSALSIANATGAALLVGTTALSKETIDLLRETSKKKSVIVAPNTSMGIAIVAQMAAKIARSLGDGYDISIVEAHHNKKKDAPSGTALRLAKAIEESGTPVKSDQIIARRGGDVVGEHTIRYAGAGEYVELTHRATTRDVFAHGALRAAAWLAHREPGWYTMEDVLGIAHT
jgi:4-hydroxy-tetrahydrodipicolinate reductase